MTKQKIIVSVTNDLATDQRVDKICNTLLKLNCDVLLVGRVLPNSIRVRRIYPTRRFKLWFNKGALFYANYNIRLFFFLLFNSFDVLWSNDLDTILANFLVSRLKNKKLISDNHEYFTEVPELVNRPKIKVLWKTLEKWIYPKLKNVTTVSPSIAKMFEEEYKIKVHLLRNVPYLNKQKIVVPSLKIGHKKIIIYQGAINVNRGIEFMVKAMKHVDNAILYLIGIGDISHEIENLINNLNLNSKVKMLGEIPFEKLYSYTLQANLGLSLEEDKGLNYRFSLPNKLFNYMQAGLPVLVANLPEMSNLVNQYRVGEIIEKHEAKHIANKINLMLNDESKMKIWSKNSLKAAQELNWENEEKIIKKMLQKC